MQEVLREKWGFKGYFVSDCWALVDLYNGHNLVKTAPEAAALALNTGCNLNCGSTYPELLKAVEEGLTLLLRFLRFPMCSNNRKFSDLFLKV